MKIHLFTPVVVALSLFSTSPVSASNIKLGIIDRYGHEVIPCEFSRIRYLKNGFFVLMKDNASGQKQSLVNQEGKEISVNIPPGCDIANVHFPVSILHHKPHSSKLPKNSILEIQGDRGYGLCNMNGEVILEPMFYAVGEPHKGLFPIYSGGPKLNSQLEFVVSVSTKKICSKPKALAQFPKHVSSSDWLSTRTRQSFQNRIDVNTSKLELPKSTIDAEKSKDLMLCYKQSVSPVELYYKPSAIACLNKKGNTIYAAEEGRVADFAFGLAALSDNTLNKENQWTLIDESGVLTDSIYADNLKIISPNLLLKSTIDSHFNKTLWVNKKQRVQQFSNFLNEYKLIGMEQAQVRKLLGSPDNKDLDWSLPDRFSHYLLSDGICGVSANSVEIEYENGRVKQWRRNEPTGYGGSVPGPWIVSNQAP